MIKSLIRNLYDETNIKTRSSLTFNPLSDTYLYIHVIFYSWINELLIEKVSNGLLVHWIGMREKKNRKNR